MNNMFGDISSIYFIDTIFIKIDLEIIIYNIIMESINKSDEYDELVLDLYSLTRDCGITINTINDVCIDQKKNEKFKCYCMVENLHKK